MCRKLIETAHDAAASIPSLIYYFLLRGYFSGNLGLFLGSLNVMMVTSFTSVSWIHQAVETGRGGGSPLLSM